MEIKVVNPGSKSTKKQEIADAVFGCEFNNTLVHQVVTAYMAGGRQGSHAQLTRSEVRGGGAKPWRQKGMGKARAGTIRSPIWVGGGRTFAKKPRDYSQKVNRKMYQACLRHILSRLVADENLIVVDSFSVEAPKTKLFIQKMKDMSLEKALFVSADIDENTYLAARNVANVNVIDTSSVDPVALLKYQKVVMTVDALKKLEESLA